MQRRLRWFGIRSRAVYLFNEEADGALSGLAALEVWTHERWHLQDPVNDVNYQWRGYRLSAWDLVAATVCEIVPTNDKLTGWEDTKTSHMRDLDGLSIAGIPALKQILYPERRRGEAILAKALENFAGAKEPFRLKEVASLV